jgi:MoxR-like ATPase
VIITSNRTRELHDALKRRCLYHWIDYPTPEREAHVVRVRAPEVSESLARKVVAAVTSLRRMDLVKKPGMAETIDWARALEFLGAEDMDLVVAEETLGSVIKDHDDYVLVRKSLSAVVGKG